MDGGLEEVAIRYRELQEEILAKEEELKELQAGTFGTNSENAEERAREFFSDASRTEGTTGTKRIDEVRQKKSELEVERDSARESLLEEIVNLQLPFEETIEPRDESVAFPFSESMPEEVIEAISEVLNEDLTSGEIRITQEDLVVESNDVEEAIERAESFIENLRTNAGTKVDIDEYLDNLRDRDKKVRLILHILHKANGPLTKKEIESRMGVEPGTLRGQLYYVLENDPYLKKKDQEFSLSETGKEVIEGYIEEYGAPDGVEQTKEVSQ
jgi:hypothetical protein